MGRNIKKIEVKIPAQEHFLRVCAYARVSSGKDAMLHSLSAQVSYYSNLIQNHKGWIYCGVYADEAKTGTKDSRENFQKMLTACREGKVDLIITKSISRFARNTVTLLQTVRELKSLGIGVYFEEQNIYTLSGEGELMMTILASYAQEESRSASENQKWRIRKGFQEGKVINLRHQYGYTIKKGSIQINKETVAIVNEIFDRVIANESYNSIAKDLHSRGIPCTLGGKWNAARISKLITNEKYIGDSLQQKTFVNNHLEKKIVKNNGELPKYYAEGTHEAIVSKEKFAKAGIIHKQRREQYESTRHGLPQTSVFTGLIKCQNCGRNYKRVTSNGTPGWNCSTYLYEGKAACAAKKIPEAILKTVICDVLHLESFFEEAVVSNILQIIVPESNRLIFYLTDGRTVERKWKDRSRKESWTPEMKEQARQKALSRSGGKKQWQEQ